MSFKTPDNVPQIALEEVEALKAIYMEDFREELVPVKSAWKVAPQREYSIHLVPHGEEFKDLVSVVLAFKKYPAEVPTLVIRKEKGISDVQIDELQRAVVDYAQQLKGQEMIFDITTFIQDYLSRHNSVIRGIKQVSFFEQMRDRREQADKAEQERALKELEKHRQDEEEAMNEQNMTLASQIQEEIEKKQAKMREQRDKRKKLTDPSIELARAQTPPTSTCSSPQFSLDSIAKGPRIHKGLLSTLYIVRMGAHADTDEERLVLKQIFVSNPHYISGEGKKKLFDAYAELRKLISIRHPNIVTIYDSRIQKVDSSWRLDILLEHCRGGSLEELVTRSGGVKLSVARSYMKQLLKAVAYLHSQNTIHKDIKCRNVLFSSGANQDEEIKLSDPLYARRLLDLHKTRPLNPSLPEEKPIPVGWVAPELVERPGVYGRKSDIWSLGRTFLEMVLGSTVYRHNDFHEIRGRVKTISDDFHSLLSQMISKDPKDRSTAMELLKHPFFDDVDVVDLPIALEVMMSASAVPSPASSFRREPPPPTPQKQSHLTIAPQTSIFATQTLSRYRLDFEELEFLGKGGFGEVVKARNRIDGRFYAIKKIRLDPRNREGNKRILREVQTLSRLHHQFVVRYYQAWFEDAAGETWHDDSEDLESDSDSEGGESAISDDEHDSIEASFENDWLTFKETSKSYPSVSISFGHGGDHNTSSEAEPMEDDEDSHDESASPSTDSLSRSSSHRVLYIQMEYCENKTLRDVINEGVDDEEGWRLFRQVLEGLAHIHSQGMIHRDLKPSNIFLDANDNVKIGDFGLALSRDDDMVPKIQLNGTDSTALDPEASLTGDVGTPVYVAPEIISKNGKYNSKVDLYSLGICFFEICYPFSSGMHRAIVLRDLRLPSITIPKDFDFKRYEAQTEIIKMLLNHVPKERPSSLELLQSPLLPPRLEEEYISEALRSIVNQNNPLYYSRLVTSIFAQSTDKHKDFTYEFNSNALSIDQLSGLVTTRMHAHALRVFQRHGAMDVPSPLLMPKSDLYDASSLKKPVDLLDSSGNIVHLPYDLTAPFARLVARVSQNIGMLPLKRYCIDHVYRCNTVGGQPRSVLECDFDIITPNLGNMSPDAEVIKVVFEIMEVAATKYSNLSQFEIRINHCSLLDAVFDSCKMPPDGRIRRRVYHVLEQLEKPMGWSQVRTHLCSNGVPPEVANELEKFHLAKGPFEAAASRLEAMVDPRVRSAVRDVVSQLRVLTRHLQHLGIKNRVTFVPLLAYNANYYKSGLMFQVAVSGKKKLDVMAAGGRYDHLLTQFRYPFGPSKKLHGVGVHFALSKAISAMVAEQAEHLRRRMAPKGDEHKLSLGILARRADVLVASFGKSSAAVEERMAVIAELWNAGISADMVYQDVQAPQDVIQQAEAQGYILSVFIKHRNSDVKGGLIKVKNLHTRFEEEVSRSDLVAHVQSEIGEHLRMEPNQHGKSRRADMNALSDTAAVHKELESGSNDVPLEMDRMFVVQPPWKKGKLKHKEKLMTMERAAHSISNMISGLRRGMVFALDLPDRVVKRLTETDLNQSEDSFRKAFETLPSNQREYVVAFCSPFAGISHSLHI
ncbi:hypothetical protein SpCBS45565_g07286 [Spizellomyces sp. 'palustris']|nr:hypothetical protein SpCBS45565_g07286 [Spizellomyces sp. 'palustris']